ncbi:MAG: transporter substrate-binding domain-containing protein [Halanaerobiales bacterium]
MNLKRKSVLTISLLLVAIIGVGCSKSDGYVIGVTTGTTYQEVAESYSNVKEVRSLKNDNFTLKELADERVDAVISDRLVALNAIKNGGFDDLEVAGDVIYNETIAVAIKQEDDALRQAINKALASMIEDGTYASISEKYFERDILEDFDYKKTFANEEEATDDSLQRVLDAGEITFAMSGGYPPFNYFEDEELVGFDVEIGKEVANRLGVEYTPITTNWSGILEGLRSGRYDGIFGSMAITDDRLEVVDFTDPYYYSGAQIIVKEGSDIKGVEDLGEVEED